LNSTIYSDNDMEVVEAAIYTLSRITAWPTVAHAAVDAKALDRMALLNSPHMQVQRWMAAMIGRLASHKSTAYAVLAVKPCPRLVALLG
jgi:hypothetical protein